MILEHAPGAKPLVCVGLYYFGGLIFGGAYFRNFTLYYIRTLNTKSVFQYKKEKRKEKIHISFLVAQERDLRIEF